MTMEVSVNTPALLFPALSVLLVAYTNRFFGAGIGGAEFACDVSLLA
jgi:hypothetical protein